MKLIRSSLAILLNVTLVSATFLVFAVSSAPAQDTNTALQRGYRTGYSDGYMAGYRDSLDNQSKDFSRHPDYNSANRAYSKDYGTVEDYRDGYQQGFETGYASGFDKKEFDSTVPTQLVLRGIQNPVANSAAASQPAAAPTTSATNAAGNNVPPQTTSEQPATTQS